ncbi:uncharacterized protein LOC144424554 isoform X1 [Styela clava]
MDHYLKHGNRGNGDKQWKRFTTFIREQVTDPSSRCMLCKTGKAVKCKRPVFKTLPCEKRTNNSIKHYAIGSQSSFGIWQGRHLLDTNSGHNDRFNIMLLFFDTF